MRRQVGAVAAVLLVGAVAVLAVGSFATADGGKRNVQVDLSGYLEVPAVSSGAAGHFEATIDGSTIDYTLSYGGLEGDVRQAHIHFGQRSATGGITAWLCDSSVNPSPVSSTPECPQSGTVSGTLGSGEVTGPAGQGIAVSELAEMIAAIRAGRTYANVHSTKFPGGEIRGQINDENQRDD